MTVSNLSLLALLILYRPINLTWLWLSHRTGCSIPVLWRDGSPWTQGHKQTTHMQKDHLEVLTAGKIKCINYHLSLSLSLMLTHTHTQTKAKTSKSPILRHIPGCICLEILLCPSSVSRSVFPSPLLPQTRAIKTYILLPHKMTNLNNWTWTTFIFQNLH